jgi:hypothetical protein
LLIEEGRTNLFARSEEFNSAPWGLIDATLSVNSTTSPDGLTTAEKLVVNSGANNGRVAVTNTLTGSHTMSIFAKAAEWSWVFLAPLGPGSGVWFNISNGSLGTQSSGFVGAVTSLGNGWYRCAVTFTGAGASASSRIVATNSSGGLSTGDGTSGIFIWGAQLEAGGFPTSYIPTTTAALARSAEVCSITGSNFTGMYNNDQGTVVTVASANGLNPSLINAVAGIESGATAVMRVLYRAAQGNRLSAQISGVLLTPASNYNTANVVYKSAITAGATGADYVIDGTQIPDTYTGSVLTADNLKFTGMSGSASNTTISSFRYYRKQLPVSKLQTLTA